MLGAGVVVHQRKLPPVMPVAVQILAALLPVCLAKQQGDVPSAWESPMGFQAPIQPGKALNIVAFEEWNKEKSMLCSSSLQVWLSAK